MSPVAPAQAQAPPQAPHTAAAGPSCTVPAQAPALA
jgi:hypothetical protein